ncbi:hypothetical protein ABD87_15020 [Lysinibacillus sphaericus]|uniref:hypothetical protein n=1 Tax=Lysinibacillus sphaericus TaxID=1421 RepID=UPI0018CDAEB5|nr:hypothetical protein [Lysinibacillus sphaericus]MBG9730803.1 hypothetical protein [Lysinibacillus sphaericus]
MATLVSEVRGVQDVQVFWLREYDAVVAHSLDEAISWYKELTGLSDDDLYDYDEIEVISPDYKMQKSEDDTQLISVKEIVEKLWDLTPFMVVTTGGHFHIELNHFFEGWDEEIKNNYFSDHNLDKVKIETASYVEIKLNNKNKECYVTFKNDSFGAISEIIKDDWCAIMDSLYKNKWYGKYELINSVKFLDS